MITIGSLFSGYRGLDMALEAITGGRTAWVSDIDPGANKVLAHRWPDTPNLGDITRIGWAAVEPVDIITGGFPCQDVSAAGGRTGLIRYGTGRNRSGLWAEMARAVDGLRPRLVVVENVRGLLSAKTDAAVDVSLPAQGVANRALGAVLGDLADLGYDAAWRVVRAADIGACHRRERVFLVAWPAHTDGAGLAQLCQQSAWHERPAVERSGGDAAPLMPTPVVTDAKGTRNSTANRSASSRPAHLGHTLTDVLCPPLLPTPAAGNFNDGENAENWLARRERIKAQGINGNGMGMPLGIAVQLLPSPRAIDGTNGGPNQRGSSGDLAFPSAVQPGRFAQFEPAVRRWEALTRPAPEPTETGPRGGQRLAPQFVEWMMGLPAGHVTAPEIGISRNDQIKLCGNGVVPQQAEFAIGGLLRDACAALDVDTPTTQVA